MRPLRPRTSIASAILSVALAAAWAAVAAAAPVGLIHEIRIHDNVAGIAAGPEGNLWFTISAPFPEDRQVAIGRITPAGKLTRFKQGLSRATEPSQIVAGPDGNLWFTYDPGLASGSGGGIGRITPSGRISLFPEPRGLHGVPFEIVAGPDGNLWFTHAAILTPTGQAIGRITPQGQISEFSAGLPASASVENLTAGPDGNVWFADTSFTPGIGRITPSGEITEFALPPREYPPLEGPEPGPEGKLWFSVNEPTVAVERVSSQGSIERFSAGLDRRAEGVGPFATGSDGKLWFSVERSPPARHRDTEAGLTAIGRLARDGRIEEFSRCLRPMPGYAGPNYLTLGPDGNVWFTTWVSGDVARPTRASTPSIGRITPRGKITEFRLGLTEESQPESLVSAGGRLWFIDRGTDSVGEIAPSREPANTFLTLPPRTRGGAVTLPVVVPGPGTLRLRPLRARRRKGRPWRPPGAAATTARRGTCGTARLRVRARRLLESGRRGSGPLRVEARITFTPRGGSPFSRRTTVTLPAGAR